MARAKEKQGGARRGQLYELFVLGELIGGPHHGYLLHEILGKILGPFRQMSWGALYPLIHRLEAEGLIAPTVRRTKSKIGEGKRGQRNLYRITNAGKERFQELMLEAVPFANYEPDLFIAKLGYFDSITSEQQTAILMHHQEYLRATDEFIRAGLAYVMSDEDIPQAEKDSIGWVNELRLLKLETEMDWVNRELEKRKE